MLIKGSVGMFISPEGEILLINGSHIQSVISDPERFGLTSAEINAEYYKHREPVGMEGRAREVLLKKVICNGWIRLRRYPNRQWSVTVAQLDTSTQRRLLTWGEGILKGITGVKEADPYMPVVITTLLDEQETLSTVDALG